VLDFTVLNPIRSIAPDDYEAMFLLDRVCFEPPFRFSRAVMRHFVETPGAFGLLLESAERDLKAFIVMQLTSVRRQSQAYIVTLDVAPASRRQGVARRLLEAAEARAAKLGASEVTLHVWTANEAAIRFYDGLGYVRVMLHQDFYAEGLDAWSYAKAIETA
jgi:ribosomal-protein-alanine N-acetyltransferase